MTTIRALTATILIRMGPRILPVPRHAYATRPLASQPPGHAAPVRDGAQKRYHSRADRGNMRLGSSIMAAEIALPRALLVDDPRFDRHKAPAHHPERPERLHAARNALATVAAAFEAVPARAATDEELLRVHEARFLEALEQMRGRSSRLDPSTYVSPESVDVARVAAGSLVALSDALIDGPVSKGVALLRPPGHHARPAQAMGFCLLNNVAVAAAHGLAQGLRRVAIVDWDVHHGNGTQEMFYDDPRVLYISLHQSPFYPGTGDANET